MPSRLPRLSIPSQPSPSSPSSSTARPNPLAGNRSLSSQLFSPPHPIASTPSTYSPQTGTATSTLTSPSTPLSPTRRRAHTVSVSLPGPSTTRPRRQGSLLPPTSEEAVEGVDQSTARPPASEGSAGRRRRSSVSRTSVLGAGEEEQHARESTSSPVGFEVRDDHSHEQELDDGVVGMLDCIDPQVSTVNHLQNMTNSIIVPHFPQLWNRRPEVVLPENNDDSYDERAPLTHPDSAPGTVRSRHRSSTTPSSSRPRSSTVSRLFPPDTPSSSSPTPAPAPPPNTAAFQPLQSVPETPATAEEDEEDHELDKHVRTVLSSSKRQAIKRTLRGVWAFVKTPMGAFTAIYGFLVAFWGAGIVLFLLGWIKTSSKERQDIWVEICSQVENGLFTLTGIGLIPWRVQDTYRMVIIWRLKRRTARLRAERGLPPIADPNDLPDPKQVADYVSVLTDKQQEQLHHQQEMFAKSQTWYKPHATATHTAFPISWALWNTILMDGNSFFQCLLCGCMWGLRWRVRPAWTTGCLIPLSFLCGIGAAVLIWRGSVRTKKRATVEDKLRAALNIPLAIGIPTTKDGTVVTGENRAPTPPTPEISLEKAGEVHDASGGEGGGGGRRATVAFGSVPDPVAEGFEADKLGGGGGRKRGVTVASPERRGDGQMVADEKREVQAVRDV